jgi:hypothetical protein
LMLNRIKHNKISFVHFPGSSSSEVLVATYGQTTIWWKIVAVLTFWSCLIWLHTLSWQKVAPLLNACRHFSPRNPDNDWNYYMEFLRLFGRRIWLNGTAVEAVKEPAALQHNLPETEGPSQLPLSYSAWHPIKQMLQQTVSWSNTISLII